MLVDQNAYLTGEALSLGVEYGFREMTESRGQAGKKAPQGFSVFKRLFDDDRPWLAPLEPVSHPEF
jgi:hypothetical protein